MKKRKDGTERLLEKARRNPSPTSRDERQIDMIDWLALIEVAQPIIDRLEVDEK